MNERKIDKKSIAEFILVIALIFAAGYVLFFGVTIGVYDIGNISKNINYV